MRTISVRNVEDALIRGMIDIEEFGNIRDSRNGPVYVFPEPVTTVYQKPRERVVFLAERDAHPFFHFMEGLWMLDGRNDVLWISEFLSNIINFSDDGVTFHGAYGHRWRKHFLLFADRGDGVKEDVGSIDQLVTICKLLRENPNDRRCVMQMWDPSVDLAQEGKDFPCNVSITFRVNDGYLDMTVFNRSNDMIWGAYGANAVHFSMMQEFVAAYVGVRVGRYWQVSTNFHAYVKEFEKKAEILNLCPGFTPYELGEVEPYPMVNIEPEQWLRELRMFIEEGPALGFTDPFFRKVAVPMLQSWRAWKNRDTENFYERARERATAIAAKDWRKACVEWLDRRAPA